MMYKLLSSFLLQHYPSLSELPHEIIVPISLNEAESLSEILSTNRPRKVQVHYPQRGNKREFAEMANLNAEATFKKEKDLHAIRERTLLEMQEKLHLNQYPRRIECFDNSNVGGKEPVAALVTFTDGEKDRKGYRKYKIRARLLAR